MKKTIQLFVLALAVAAAAFHCGDAAAQPRGNGDPAQFQQQMQERLAQYIREQLVVTNDDEWNVIEPRLAKVTKVKMETMFSGMSAFRGMGGNRGNGGNGDNGGAPRRNFPPPGQSSPEADALQKAIDSKAPKQEIQAALDNLRQARKRKQAELAAAQEELRQVLTLRQEAILVSMSLLE